MIKIIHVSIQDISLLFVDILFWLRQEILTVLSGGEPTRISEGCKIIVQNSVFQQNKSPVG